MAPFFQDMATRAPEWADKVRDVAMVMTIVAGLMNALFGYRLFRLFFACLGFVLGAAIGGYLGYTWGPEGDVIWPLVGGLAGGIIGALTLFGIYLAGVFVAGGMVAALLVTVALAGAGITVPHVILVIPVLLGGALALTLHKTVIILASSFGGALGVVYGGAMLGGREMDLAGLVLQRPRIEQVVHADPDLWAAWFVLGLCGAFVQYRFTARSKKDRSSSDSDD